MEPAHPMHLNLSPGEYPASHSAPAPAPAPVFTSVPGRRVSPLAPGAGAEPLRRWESRGLIQLTRYHEKEIESMPVLSKFYGIVIRMVFTRSIAAHFHAIYGGNELVVAIAPLRVIQGDAPARVQDLVLEWAGQHQRELLTAWSRCGLAMPPAPIAPLQ